MGLWRRLRNGLVDIIWMWLWSTSYLIYELYSATTVFWNSLDSHEDYEPWQKDDVVWLRRLPKQATRRKDDASSGSETSTGPILQSRDK